jgi:hypothetical protein
MFKYLIMQCSAVSSLKFNCAVFCPCRPRNLIVQCSVRVVLGILTAST